VMNDDDAKTRTRDKRECGRWQLGLIF